MKSKLRPSAIVAAEIRDTCSPCELRHYLQSKGIDLAITRHRATLELEMACLDHHFDPSASEYLDAECHNFTAAVEKQFGHLTRKAILEKRPGELAGLLALRDAMDSDPAVALAVAKVAPLAAELESAIQSEAELERIAADKRQILRDELEARRAAVLADLAAEESAALAAVS